MMRDIMAASTEREVFVSTRSIMSARTVSISWEEMSALIMKSAVPRSRETFSLSSTNPVRARVMLVISIPNTVVTSVRMTSDTMSPVLMQFFRYRIRSGIPSFFCGSGR